MVASRHLELEINLIEEKERFKSKEEVMDSGEKEGRKVSLVRRMMRGE